MRICLVPYCTIWLGTAHADEMTCDRHECDAIRAMVLRQQVELALMTCAAEERAPDTRRCSHCGLILRFGRRRDSTCMTVLKATVQVGQL